MKLRQARQSAGLTVQQLVIESGVSRQTYTNAENGKALRIEFATRIVNALNTLAHTKYTVRDLEMPISNR